MEHIQEFAAIQRPDRSVRRGDGPQISFPLEPGQAPTSRAAGFFNGPPGHAQRRRRNAPTGEPKGLIADLQCRPDGLYCLPVFTNEGRDLLNAGRKLFFSGRWTSDELPAENGRRIFRPAELKSAGLTPHPNLPVHHANDLPPSPPSGERAGVRGRGDDGNQPQPPLNQMNKKLILDLLATHGVTFANDASDEQIVVEIQKLGERAEISA